MSKFTKEHYVLVAGLLKGQISSAPPLNWIGHIAKVETNATVRRIAHRFADLFAADNPESVYCGYCGDQTEDTPCLSGMQPDRTKHSFVYHKGFDREQFLAACGLEPARPYSTSMLIRPEGEPGTGKTTGG